MSEIASSIGNVNEPVKCIRCSGLGYHVMRRRYFSHLCIRCEGPDCNGGNVSYGSDTYVATVLYYAKIEELHRTAQTRMREYVQHANNTRAAGLSKLTPEEIRYLQVPQRWVVEFLESGRYFSPPSDLVTVPSAPSPEEKDSQTITTIGTTA